MQEADHRSIGTGRQFLTATGLAYAGPPAAYLLALSAFLKTNQVIATSGEFSVTSSLLAWAPDAAFALFFLAIFTLATSLARSWGRLAVVATMLLTALYVASLNVASWGYFVSTGANLSWSSIEYWLVNFEEASGVIASEGSGGKFVLVASQVVGALLFAILAALPIVRRRLKAARPFGKKTVVGFYAMVSLVATIFAVLPAADGPAASLCQNVPMNILSDLIEDEILPTERVTIRADEKLDSSLDLEIPEGQPRYNVVLIMFESLRWKSSDVYVPDLETTPFLADLAKDSVVVEDEYTVVPHTTKAVTAINCGIYPYLDTEPKEASPGILPRRCLAHILKSQGYETAFFQPAGNFEKRDRLVSNLGYDTYRGLNDMPQEGFENTNYFGKEEKMMLGPSMDWVDSVKGRPFLLTYMTLCTHHNYVTPQSFARRDFGVDDEDLNNYLNAVRYTDQFISEVFDEFEKRGLMDNTIFIIVGDHGEAFGEHGRRQHDLVPWEEGLHSFSMLHAPWLLSPGTIEGTRSHLDIVPTVVDLLGFKVKKGDFLGTSLLKPVEPDRKLHMSCWFKRRCLALREGNLKTIYHFEQMPMEVYDNALDPYDEHNLAYTGKYDQKFLDDRKEEMLRWTKVVNQQYDDWKDQLLSDAVTESQPRLGKELHATWGDNVELLGVDITPGEVKAGQDVTLRYVFRATGEIEATDKLFVHINHGPGGFLNGDHEPVRGALPVHKWPIGQYIVDEHQVHIPGTWKSGSAQVSIGFWNTRTKKRLATTSTDGEVDDNRVVVGHIDITGRMQKQTITVEQRRDRIRQWISFEAPKVSNPMDLRFDNKVQLVGVELHRVDVKLAGTVEVDYVFKALKPIPANWKLKAQLVREDAGATIDGDHTPIGGLYPPHLWREGEYVTDKHRIHIDMHRSKPGTYGLWVGFDRGKAPIVPEGDGVIDKAGRVRIATITISAH